MATDSKTVTIAGHKEPRTAVYLFGAVAIGVVAYAVIQKRKNAAAAGSGTAAGFTDPAGNTCSAPNPATGYCPGTPEDISATEEAAGDGNAYGLSGGGASAPPSLYGNGSGLTSEVPTFTDNGSWGQYVEQALGSDGTDAIAAAIAKYLNGAQITEAQATTVEQAIAIANLPPVAGPGGYPPSLQLSSGTPPVTSPASGTVKVPLTVGSRVETAVDALHGAGLVASYPAQKPGMAYYVTASSPAHDASAAAGSTVTLTTTTKKP